MIKKALRIAICFLAVLLIGSCGKAEPEKETINNKIDNAADDVNMGETESVSFPDTLVIHGVIHESIGKEDLAPYAVLREPRVCNSRKDYTDYCLKAEEALPQDCKKQFPDIPDTWFKNQILIVLFLEEAIDVKTIETRLDTNGCLWIFLTVTSKDRWLDGYTERTRLLSSLLIPWNKASEDDNAIRSLEICMGEIWNEQKITAAMAK